MALLREGHPYGVACRQVGVPRQTVRVWANTDPVFARELEEAKQEGYDSLAEETLTIADTPQMGKETVTGFDGDKVFLRETTADMLGHRKLQIATRLQLLGKWDPKRYGAQIQAQLSVDDGLAAQLERALARVEKASGD